MTVATDKKRLVTYISVDVADKLQLLAEVRLRTISNMIEFIITEAVTQAEETGEIKPSKDR
jgi:hypothetical protein